MYELISWDANSGNPIVYWLLKIITYAVLLYCGWGISNKNEKLFSRYAWIAIIFYSLFEGLRWNRGADYYHYYLDLIGKWYTPDPEYVYELIVNILSNILFLPYWGSFIIYSIILLYPVLLLLKQERKIAIWTLPLFALVTETAAECFIRQYLAIAFVLYAFYGYYIKDRKRFLIPLLVAPFIHFGSLFLVVLILFITSVKFDTRLRKPWLLILIFVALYFLYDTSYIEPYVKYLEALNVIEGNKMSGYIEQAERWFTNEGSLSERTGTMVNISWITLSFSFAINIIIIYFGFSLSKKGREYRMLFWLSYFAIIVKCLAGDIEILLRFYNWLLPFIPFLIGCILTKLVFSKKMRIIVYAIVILYYYVYGFIIRIGTFPYAGCAFIWDR